MPIVVIACNAALIWRAVRTDLAQVAAEPDYINHAIGNATTPERKASLMRIRNHVRRFEESIGLLEPGSVDPLPAGEGREAVLVRRVKHGRATGRVSGLVVI